MMATTMTQEVHKTQKAQEVTESQETHKILPQVVKTGIFLQWSCLQVKFRDTRLQLQCSVSCNPYWSGSLGDTLACKSHCSKTYSHIKFTGSPSQIWMD